MGREEQVAASAGTAANLDRWLPMARVCVNTRLMNARYLDRISGNLDEKASASADLWSDGIELTAGFCACAAGIAPAD